MKRMGFQQADKYLKWIVKILILSNLYGVISTLLVIAGKTRFEEVQVSAIFLRLFGVLLACILIKKTYWILAFVFKGVDSITHVIASTFVEVPKNIHELPLSSLIALIVGIVFLLLSSFFFLKLLQIQDLASSKSTYKWMRDLDNYFKRKFRTGK